MKWRIVDICFDLENDRAKCISCGEIVPEDIYDIIITRFLDKDTNTITMFLPKKQWTCKCGEAKIYYTDKDNGKNKDNQTFKLLDFNKT